ncbi:uncharacterized protein LOC142180150 [Nicotiana tabacum]|uniref:Uncharacterized protein LOC142180150 n=1 Tax=Nicotiana tabacum TaxID=4097 RepID=A0AC58UCI9_TOBAC
MITNREEKLGGRSHRLEESMDFIECLNECGLPDAGFTGAKHNCHTPIQILLRSCSDHAPLLVKLHHEDIQGARYFKFLNFWTEHPDFIQTVQNIWSIYIQGNALFILQQKIKNTTKFNEGDANTAYFHATIKEKRRKLTIRRIQDGEGNWLEDYESFAEGIVNFYKNLFSEDSSNTDFRELDCIERCITDEDNTRISAIPTLQEVTDIVLSIDANSSPGHDGLSGMFYHKCWDIISEDVYNAVKAVFRGSTLTKFYTHTCIVMIPKVDHPQSFSDLRPISLYGTILFCNENKRSMRLVLSTLTEYEKISRQLINKNKSCFAMSTKTNLVTINRMKAITGMKYQKFPIKYLGCPLTTGRNKIEFYSDIVNKVIGRIRGWHTKLLSTGGRAILIRHVLLALPIHLLAAMNPPKGTLELIEKFVAKFFWSGQDSGGKYYWAAWKNLCYPYCEGDANFRRLSDTCKAFRA